MELADLNPKNLIVNAISGIANAASGIIKDFKADPTKVAEAEARIQELTINAGLKAQELSNQLEEINARELETVNATMREESKSEHFLQYSWRPIIGYVFGGILVNNYIVVPYLHKYGVEIISIPDQVFTAILVILGAASAGRGVTQWQKEKNKG